MNTIIRHTRFNGRLAKAITQFPRKVAFHTVEGQAIANIKAKATSHIKQHPRGRAEFDCMFRPIF